MPDSMCASVCRVAFAVCASALLLVPAESRAQTPQVPPAAPVPATAPARRLSLDDALLLAEGGSEQVAAAEAGVRRADGQISLARSGLYPQLNSAFGYQRTLQTQFDGIFDADSTAPPCADLTVNPGAPIEDRVAELERYLQCPPSNPFGGGDDNDLPFGQLNTWTANLQFTQMVYDGGETRARERQARAGRDAATIGVTTTRAQLDLDVAIAFYDAALTDRLVAITESTLTQAAETLQQIELQFQVGQIAEFEVLRARVSRDAQRAAVIRTRVNRDLAYLRLKQLINVPADQPIALDANLSEPNGPLAARWAATLAEAEAGLKLVERAAVRQSEAGVQADEAAVAVTQAQFKPYVSLTSSFIAYAYDPAPIFDRRDWNIGAAVSLPILDGGRRKASRAIAQATLEESQQLLQQAREIAELETRSAHAAYLAARAQWESTSGTVEQAQRAYQIADVRYREGLSTQLELNDARLALERAEAERSQAARDLQVTRARLALLPDLPLGSVTGGGATATAVATGAAQPGQAGATASGTGAVGAGATGTVGATGTQTGVRQ
jgi:outer membrane protein TolC